MDELIIPIVAISVTGAVIIVGMIGGFVILAVRSFRGGRGRNPEADRTESQLIQEIHYGLNRMEERVEVLETLLLDKVDRPKSGARADREDR